MKTIQPLFPNQKSIIAAINKLSPESYDRYQQLKHEYEAEIKKDNPDHEKVSFLIRSANEILNDSMISGPTSVHLN